MVVAAKSFRSLKMRFIACCRLKAARNKLQSGSTQPLTVPAGVHFLYEQLLFNEAKARQIDAGKFKEKDAVLEPTTTAVLQSFLSVSG